MNPLEPRLSLYGGYGSASRSSCLGFGVGVMNEWVSFHVESLRESDMYSPSSQTL